MVELVAHATASRAPGPFDRGSEQEPSAVGMPFATAVPGPGSPHCPKVLSGRCPPEKSELIDSIPLTRTSRVPCSGREDRFLDPFLRLRSIPAILLEAGMRNDAHDEFAIHVGGSIRKARISRLGRKRVQWADPGTLRRASRFSVRVPRRQRPACMPSQGTRNRSRAVWERRMVGRVPPSCPSAGIAIRHVHADRHDVGLVILLVANPGREVPQQPERDFPSDQVLLHPFAEQRKPVLQISAAPPEAMNSSIASPSFLACGS